LAKEVELKTDNILLAKIGNGIIAFLLAAENNDVQTLKRMWVCYEETELNPKT
jgi:hypothetical protein